MDKDKNTQSLLKADPQKRFEEIKKSDELIKGVNEKEFIRPSRLDQQINGQKNEDVNIIKPRKKQEPNFSAPERNELEKTIGELTTELRDKHEKIIKKQKMLMKEENKVNKLLNKYSKKIEVMKNKGVSEEKVEKTIELKEIYENKLSQIHQNLKLVDPQQTFDQNMSLKDRRKKIYDNAYNSETRRAQKLVAMREAALSNKKAFNWESHVDYSESVKPEKQDNSIHRRKGSWAKEVEKYNKDNEE
ncbi:hypothetical protein SGLAD_v1c08770 [Spiroplasma gladiatoris]|uniref:Uncharacterized protein n=1 Tax=Spiroplasma gladiatoris TaxID=2143 RepID=A0A4P7AK82_9MOLU|nr:hypothetical protein [Spiroplasma gladiatoris]QBQ08076.1 hypothetical protein SGLAD_v1c08770 [Spiroplasma gladiatoris]